MAAAVVWRCKPQGETMFNAIKALFVALAVAFALPAHADKTTLKANITEAREKVKAIVGGADVAANKKDIVALSAKIDAEIDVVPGLKPVWTEFKQTRDAVIIPAYESGKADQMAKAKELALGIQAERFAKMMELVK
jgi:hypothetical protein